MNFPRSLFSRLGLSSIRSRMLMIALLPALLTEFGMVAYFTSQALANAETALHARAANAARHLAEALPYALVSGDTRLVRSLLNTETANSQLAMARVTNPRGQALASTGEIPHNAPAGSYYIRRAMIYLPSADLRDDPLSHSGRHSDIDLLGQVDVGVALDWISAFKRDTLIRATLLMLVALTLTGALAWRLSNRLAGQLRHVGQVVEELARGDLGTRTQPMPPGEVGALAAGVNDMAESLQTHRGELEERIREATADLAAKKD
ncbi:MAG: hypothetical protein QG662_275, partial [Pseudomonadota bacterium]|nr:hypothetical protein [Pseudomonadota bacterium]